MLRLLLILTALFALVCGAVYWSGSDQGQPADFAFINRGENKSLDPGNMSWMQDIRISYALWEGLYTLDPITLKPVLGCADSAAFDAATHTVWIIHIRPNARWTNGDPVLAQDFLFSWRRFLETPGEYTYLHFYIKGAKKYSQDYQDYVNARLSGDTKRQPPDFSMVGEKVLDDHTLQVTLADPIPFFPCLLAFTPFFPLNQKSMQPFAQTDPVTGVTTYDEKFTRPPYLVTDGPYRLAEWTFKRRLRMIKSNFYWDRANVKSRVIDEIYVDQGLAEYRAYERGEADWLSEVDPDLASAMLEKGGRSDLHVFPAFGTYFYSFNCLPKLPDGRPNPMADARVRQALCLAIDKNPIVTQVTRLGEPVTDQYIPQGVFDGYVSPPGLHYDVAAAQRLLAEAGYPGGRGFPHLTILYNNEFAAHADIAQILRRQWLTNLGIDTDLEGVEIKIFGERLHSQQYDIARASWFGDYQDPTTFTDKYKSDSDDNDSKWNSPQYDAICAAAQKETDPGNRIALLSQAEALLLQQAPIMPLYNYVNAYMFHSNVKGIPLAPNAMLTFNEVEVQR
jgi:oligopeptide transport system substrate-binding protein